jgi:hypothetical protein
VRTNKIRQQQLRRRMQDLLAQSNNQCNRGLMRNRLHGYVGCRESNRHGVHHNLDDENELGDKGRYIRRSESQH